MRSIIFLVCLMSAIGCTNSAKRVRPSMETVSMSSDAVCFSPLEGCDLRLVEFIRSAEHSLDVAVFDITHPQIVHELLVASKKIPVRIVVDKRQSREPHSLVSTLLEAGAKVKYGYQRGIMHHKFILVDEKALQTGSFNYTLNAAFKNQENQVYIEDPSVVKRFKNQFEKMWKEGRAL